jgi:hypothetical protein
VSRLARLDIPGYRVQGAGEKTVSERAVSEER